MLKRLVFEDSSSDTRWYHWIVAAIAWIVSLAIAIPLCLGLWFGSSWVGWRIFEAVF